MRARLSLLGVALALVPIMGAGARAQMFGDRTLGRMTGPRTSTAFDGLGAFGSRQSSASRTSGAGRSSGSGQSSATAAEMFGFGTITDRRARGGENSGFVGADSGDIRGFVGMQQAENTGRIESAVSDLRIETGPDANRPGAAVPRTRVRMYDPRLKVSFDFAPRPTAEVSTDLTRRLQSSLQSPLQSSLMREAAGSIEVSKEGTTAILRGEVASERDRRLARLLLLLEPGISNVQNQLIVSPPGSTPANPRSTEPAARAENQP